MTPGETIRVDFPGHVRHGKPATVVDVVDINLAPDDSVAPLFATTVMITWPGLPEPIGIPPCRVRGHPQNRALFRLEKGDDNNQGELAL